MYDVIIVGAGPAGITAAVYAARKRMKTLIVSKDVGGQAAQSWDIENYTGYQLITGLELVGKFEEHLKTPGLEPQIGANSEVVSVTNERETFTVNTPGATYTSEAVIIATGRKPNLLKAKGELEFKNRGVTYCTTCDGPLFAGKDVAIIGGGNSAVDATIQMMEIANQVYLIDIAGHIIGDPVMMEKVKAAPNVTIMNRTEVREILGDKFVNGIRVLVEKKDEKTIPVEGVFIEIGSMPVKEPSCNVKHNEKGEIIVNERCETDVKGVFAAGDVTSVPEKQIIVAAGQGCIAALSAYRYLSKKKTNIAKVP